MTLGYMLVIAVMAIVLVIGVIFIVIHFKNHQREEAIADFLLMFGVEVIASSFGTLDDKIFAFLSHEEVTTNWAQLVSGFIIFGIGLFLMLHSKSKMFILNLNGMFHDRRIDNHHKEVGLNPFQFKEKEVDFVRIFKKPMTAEIANEIIEEIEHKVEVFKQESKDKKRGYTGIASIPFVMIAGRFFERQSINDYFEFDKFNQSYYKLSSKARFPKLNLRRRDVLQSISTTNCEEIAIAISITASITDQQLSQFQCPHIHLSVERPDENLIRYKEQLHSYVKITYDTINDAHEKLPNLKRIHLLISSQSSFAFELGKLIEDSRMPLIINYQYDTQSTPKYPWGIIINGNNKGSFIKA